jgi:hypothetical protein
VAAELAAHGGQQLVGESAGTAPSSPASPARTERDEGDSVKILIGVLGWLALIAAGLFVDIYLLLVKGVKEIVQGAQAAPANGNVIAWGTAHVVFFGIGLGIAFALGLGLNALLAGMD